MNNFYRVEAHDGKGWSFGIRNNENKRVPEFCSLAFAEQFLTREEATKFCDKASRLCGGTLRVALVGGDA
jgi:hypothetical protein